MIFFETFNTSKDLRNPSSNNHFQRISLKNFLLDFVVAMYCQIWQLIGFGWLRNKSAPWLMQLILQQNGNLGHFGPMLVKNRPYQAKGQKQKLVHRSPRGVLEWDLSDIAIRITLDHHCGDKTQFKSFFHYRESPFLVPSLTSNPQIVGLLWQKRTLKSLVGQIPLLAITTLFANGRFPNWIRVAFGHVQIPW